MLFFVARILNMNVCMFVTPGVPLMLTWDATGPDVCSTAASKFG
jgi:hypothetical protein